jgi:mRNA interferase RelE/StbE
MPPAKKHLLAISDQRIRRRLIECMEGLADEPEKQGKMLTGELSGLRSIRAVGQRYRIIYRVEAKRVEVLVIAIGLRREGDRADIYELTKRLLRLGLLEP